jgi:starvation-inducible DNA-binding protein
MLASGTAVIGARSEQRRQETTLTEDHQENRMARRTSLPRFTVPTLDAAVGAEVATILQLRLHALNDLALTLKHVHWNVVGPHFIGVHEMIDPQVDVVRAYADETAERIATLGSSVKGTPGAIVE